MDEQLEFKTTEICRRFHKLLFSSNLSYCPPSVKYEFSSPIFSSSFFITKRHCTTKMIPSPCVPLGQSMWRYYVIQGTCAHKNRSPLITRKSRNRIGKFPTERLRTLIHGTENEFKQLPSNKYVTRNSITL